VQSLVLPHDFSKEFTKFDDYEAYLDFSVKLPQLTEEEKAVLREKKAKEKAEKEARRERKRAERKRAEEKKKALMDEVKRQS